MGYDDLIMHNAMAGQDLKGGFVDAVSAVVFLKNVAANKDVLPLPSAVFDVTKSCTKEDTEATAAVFRASDAGIIKTAIKALKEGRVLVLPQHLPGQWVVWRLWHLPNQKKVLARCADPSHQHGEPTHAAFAALGGLSRAAGLGDVHFATDTETTPKQARGIDSAILAVGFVDDDTEMESLGALRRKVSRFLQPAKKHAIVQEFIHDARHLLCTMTHPSIRLRQALQHRLANPKHAKHINNRALEKSTRLLLADCGLTDVEEKTYYQNALKDVLVGHRGLDFGAVVAPLLKSTMDKDEIAESLQKVYEDHEVASDLISLKDLWHHYYKDSPALHSFKDLEHLEF